MTIDSWKKYINNNFSDDKIEVLFKLIESKQLNYSEFKELLKYVQEAK